MGHVEFISYNGEWPNLCSGKLILRIDGRERVFDPFDQNTEQRFWSSGGRTWFDENYSKAHIDKDSWIIDRDFLPDDLKQYAEEIEYIFNENVEYGCCGGCI